MIVNTPWVSVPVESLRLIAHRVTVGDASLDNDDAGRALLDLCSALWDDRPSMIDDQCV